MPFLGDAVLALIWHALFSGFGVDMACAGIRQGGGWVAYGDQVREEEEERRKEAGRRKEKEGEERKEGAEEEAGGGSGGRSKGGEEEEEKVRADG